MKLCTSIPICWTAIVLILLGLSACSGTDNETPKEQEPELTAGDGTSSGKFVLKSVAQVDITEGLSSGTSIPIILDRNDGHNKTVTLSVEDADNQENRLFSFTANPPQLVDTQSVSSIEVFLAIDDLPIMAQQKNDIRHGERWRRRSAHSNYRKHTTHKCARCISADRSKQYGWV